MKKLFYILSIALMACGIQSCKNQDINDEMREIKIEIDTIRATAMRATLTPSRDNTYYTFGAITKTEAKSYATDEDLMRSQVEIMEFLYNVFIEIEPSAVFSDLFLYRGKQTTHETDLEPNTDYELIAFQMNQKTHEPIGDLYRVRFHTSSIDSVDVTFQVRFSGDTLIIIPSDDAVVYTWDYDLMSDVDEDYWSKQDYMTSNVTLLEDYGFIEYELDTGTQKWVLSEEDPSMKEGETYLLYVVGYNGELNSEPLFVKFIYHQSGSEIVETE